ncbi:sigma-70 family RNA polymerase sigma factor [Microbacterium sp. KSW4-11]|uniref:Sigma-70 family RNA polymerase sigma factor n=1 Tax=Microbacterium gawkjiense TaxID=3067309 RepID=A0ABU3G6B7_9MICO|nr:sigma-70 family RNA polymerase sigma factor [Microbacterium sp. KSW4-11]MDT3315353.1 sigma-70 family RNA polymerase sigma factor [Microbacterium sp. KSW4-11]
MNDDDAADWALVLADDPRGLTRLFERHERRLLRHAARTLDVADDAKDAVAIGLFELWRRRRAVHLVAGSPVPWLFTAVSNAALNLERSRRRYRDLLRRAPIPERTDRSDVDESGVLAALKRLPARERHVIVLAVLEGYSERETADALGVPAGTVKSRLARAKARLRGELEGLVAR